MKKTLYIFFALFLVSAVVVAQTSTRTILDEINTPRAGQGKVRVLQDETIDPLLAKFQINSDTSSVIRLSNDRINGFKIQVFSGSDQNKSRAEAEYKQSLLRESFPQHQAVVSLDSPFWRLRVGNFVTRADAEYVLIQMKETFPKFGKEMYIVSDIIRRPLNR